MRKLQVLYLAILFICATSFKMKACDSHYQRFNSTGCYENFIQVFNELNLSGSLQSIVIDPGHGGKDHGCSGASSKEKHLALSIALKLGTLLNQDFPEIEVLYTRKTDVFVPLQQRIDFANSNNADLFISIHCNSLSISSVRGSETYVLGLESSEENLGFIQRENQEAGLEIKDNSPLALIVSSNHQNAFLSQSIAFAEKVEAQLSRSGHSRSLGVKQAGFVVLRQASMPSVLIETGFLTNLEDEKLLKSESGQYSIAHCILSAVAEYKNEQHINAEYKASFVNDFTSVTEIHVKPKTEYFVQLAASSQLIELANQEDFQEFAPIVIKSENGWYKYLLGGFSDEASARKVKEKLKSSKYNSSFIVSYSDGERLIP